MKKRSLRMSFAAAAAAACVSAPAYAQSSAQENVPVSQDRSLLESTVPSTSIVRPVTVPEEGNVFSRWWNGDAASGDWFGIRTALVDHGVTPFGSYEANMAGNVTGGLSRGFNYADNFDFGVRLDLDKIIGWQGAMFTVEAADRNGRSLTNDHIGNFYQVQQLYGVQTVSFYGLYLTQKLWDDRISIKLGRFAMAEDFASSPIYGLYMGNGIDGNPKSLVATGGFSSYPGSVWAARIRYRPTQEWEAAFGVYQANNRLYNPKYHGLDWSMRDGDGVTLVGQIGWSPEFFKKPVSSGTASVSDGKSVVDGKSVADGKSVRSFKDKVEMKGLPGHYWFGSYVSLWDVPQFGSTTKTQGLYGFYWHADQMVFQESPGSDQGLTAWADFVLQPSENVAILPYQLSGGLIYKGLIPTRDEDILLFGVVWGKFSRDYARAQSDAGLGNPDYELVLETGYRVQLTKFMYVMPDLQYIINPAGTGDIGNALVLGARIGVTF